VVEKIRMVEVNTDHRGPSATKLAVKLRVDPLRMIGVWEVIFLLQKSVSAVLAEEMRTVRVKRGFAPGNDDTCGGCYTRQNLLPQGLIRLLNAFYGSQCCSVWD
jgi:hypothetical protein